MQSKNEIVRKIVECLETLSSTDYKAIKYAEGEISEEDYKPTREMRKRCRADINELEERLKMITDENSNA